MAVINSRTALVDGYWAVGKAIREASPKGEITDLLHDVAVDSGVSERLLWYAVKAYDTYPDSVAIPEGNNITWHKLITKYLTTPEPEKDCNHEWIEVCKKCGKRK